MLKTKKLISLVLVVAMMLSVCAVGIFSAGAVADGYFLVGNINGDNSWQGGIHEDLQFTENAESDGEFLLTGVSLSAGDAIKVVDVAGDTVTTWYPDGMGNDYPITEAGTYDFYFRPDGQGGSDWYNGFFYVDGPKGDSPDPQPETGTPEPIGEGGFYVVGNMTSWGPDASYMLTKNDAAETDEYQIFGVALTTESQFKVAYSANGSTISDDDWYPDGMGNNYGENGEITEDGTYNIYFRPNGDGGDDWFYNVIYVEAAGSEPETQEQPETQEPQPGETAIIVNNDITAGGADKTYPVEVGQTYTFTTYFDASSLSDDGTVKAYEGFVQFDDSCLDVEAIDDSQADRKSVV